MPKNRSIRVSGTQREPLDVDLITQLVVLLGRQLAAEAAVSMSDSACAGTSGLAPGAPSA